jgi:hypothetical protein
MRLAGMRNACKSCIIIKMSTENEFVPIYTTSGDTGAILLFPYIFNLSGEWIGWVDEEQTVYSVHGHYVGKLTKDPRIIRKREWGYGRERRLPPAPPDRIHPPAHFPLAPQLPEIPTFMVDVLEEFPELLPSMDFGDLRDDMD